MSASPPPLARLRGIALAVGAVALAACAAGALLDTGRFLRAWLVAEMLWLGVALGCLALAMLHHLTRGAWGLPLRRVLEAASRTLPLLALLFLPLVFGLPQLYPWARPEEVAHEAALQHREAWMNPPAWIARSLVVLLGSSLLAWRLARLSRRQDTEPGEAARLGRRMRVGSAVGLLAYALAATLLAVDWLMSLETAWASTAYGVLLITAHVLSGMAFAVLAALWLARSPPLAGRVNETHLHDWGNLLLAFVMLWGYVAFSQYLLVWSADLPEEVAFYLHRQGGGWTALSVALVALRFALPFALLLSRPLKRRARPLAAVALLLLATQWLDLLWLVMPAFSPGELTLSWLDVAAPLAVGGLWLAAFAHALAGRPLMPLGDPFLQEAPTRD